MALLCEGPIRYGFPGGVIIFLNECVGLPLFAGSEPVAAIAIAIMAPSWMNDVREPTLEPSSLKAEKPRRPKTSVPTTKFSFINSYSVVEKDTNPLITGSMGDLDQKHFVGSSPTRSREHDPMIVSIDLPALMRAKKEFEAQLKGLRPPQGLCTAKGKGLAAKPGSTGVATPAVRKRAQLEQASMEAARHNGGQRAPARREWDCDGGRMPR